MTASARVSPAHTFGLGVGGGGIETVMTVLLQLDVEHVGGAAAGVLAQIASPAMPGTTSNDNSREGRTTLATCNTRN